MKTFSFGTPHPVLRTTLSLRERDFSETYFLFENRLIGMNFAFIRTRASLSVSKIYTLSIGDAFR